MPRILKENGFIEEFIRLPTMEEALRSARIFMGKLIFTERSCLPSIFWAAIEGTHVEVWVETKDKTSHWNGHPKLSLNVMIVANLEVMIHALKANSPGSDNDMKVFKESKLYKAFVKSHSLVPRWLEIKVIRLAKTVLWSVTPKKLRKIMNGKQKSIKE